MISFSVGNLLVQWTHKLGHFADYVKMLLYHSNVNIDREGMKKLSVAYIFIIFSFILSVHFRRCYDRVHIMILGFVKFCWWLFSENSILEKLRFIDIHWLNDIFSSKRYKAALLVS